MGGLLCRAVKRRLPACGELAAVRRLRLVGEERAAVLVAERHLGAAFGEANRTPLPFAGNAIAVRRIEIGETHLPLPARLDRPDFDGGHGLEFAFGNFVELLATWDAALEHLGIVELGPHHLAARGELNLPVHDPRHGVLRRSRASDIKRRHGTGKALSAWAARALAPWRAAYRRKKAWLCAHRRRGPPR